MFSLILNTSDLTKDAFLILFNSYNSVTHESQHFNKIISSNVGMIKWDHYQQLAIGCYINLINKNT